MPLLAAPNSWVVQGRTCAALALLLRQELSAHQARPAPCPRRVSPQLVFGPAT